ncbi:hypothetical protein GCM10010912_64660 [Paenibacillus albidus]|uniref:Uncharacterized protein n=1 Tax=Paenibacillus albidus TaxID=2041023 RepID=A0A917D5E6_9BACL|nr:hypothetical protein GCM10010912_64660 [Paenibacillus albidus]
MVCSDEIASYSAKKSLIASQNRLVLSKHPLLFVKGVLVREAAVTITYPSDARVFQTTVPHRERQR